MYNNAEITATKLSPTKKDFYQIWNELIEISGKLSERWDPSATNESDPGVVLLKVLTAIADKLNYNIDANTLEAFLPSAAQEASVRKICDMLGYNMTYYKSATTTAYITFDGTDADFPTNSPNIFIDQFTNLKDIDDTINYITIEPVSLSKGAKSTEVLCMEGELVECETDNQNIVSLHNLDDNNRYYLPETQIAANGIFIADVINAAGLLRSWLSLDKWTLVDNLNSKEPGERIFKFGYDSSLGLPYIQFPDDIGDLIGNGLNIRYVRTKGSSGNISARTLCKMEKPASWSSSTQETESSTAWQDVEKYIITNTAAARNGANPETIDSAYWNYKKTIGTFDTLVTCKDYMNKIYQLVDESTSRPVVSNIIVSDIRDDINHAHTLCTMTSSGTEYLTRENEEDNALTRFDIMLYPFTSYTGVNTEEDFNNSFTFSGRDDIRIESGLSANKTLAHAFKYPNQTDILCLKNYYQLSARITTAYKVSQGEADEISSLVHAALYKAFNMRYMHFGEEIPYDEILKVIETADSRIISVGLEEPTLRLVVQLVDGKEYPLLNCTNISDTKSLTKDDLITYGIEKYRELVLNNVLAGRISLLKYNTDFESNYNEAVYTGGKLNITAGNLETAFNYDTYFTSANNVNTKAGEDKLVCQVLDKEESNTGSDDTILQKNVLKEQELEYLPSIKEIRPEFEIDLKAWEAANRYEDLEKTYLQLEGGEVVQFRLPNLRTTFTYPAYVNYYLNLNSEGNTKRAVPATMQSLSKFFANGNDSLPDEAAVYHWQRKLAHLARFLMGLYVDSNYDAEESAQISTSQEFFSEVLANTFSKTHDDFPIKPCTYDDIAKFELLSGSYPTHNGSPFFTLQADALSVRVSLVADAASIFAADKYFKLDLNADTFRTFKQWVTTFNVPINGKDGGTSDEDYKELADTGKGEHARCVQSFYLRYNSTEEPGYLIDNANFRYKEVPGYAAEFGSNTKSFMSKIYVPVYHATDTDDHTYNGLGAAPVVYTLPAGTEYQLKAGEYLLINYTTSQGQAEGVAVPKNIRYGAGTIIRPNFEISDSKEQALAKQYHKTTGFGPFLASDTGEALKGSFEGGSLAGMYTLGAQDQIEIREPVIITLDSEDTRVSWKLNNNRTRLFDNGELTYDLQPGEYFFYKSSDEVSMVYYGFGTRLELVADDGVTAQQKGAVANAFSGLTGKINIEDIINYGIVSSIPWKTIDFGKVKLKIIEYQYINLTQGDIVKDIKCTSSQYINHEFVDCKGASFICGGVEDTLPNISIDNYSWQVASRLTVDMSTVKPQLLTTHQSPVKYTVSVLRDGSGNILTDESTGEPKTIETKLVDSYVIARTSLNLYGNLNAKDLAALGDPSATGTELVCVQSYTPLAYNAAEEGAEEAMLFTDLAIYSNRSVSSSGETINLVPEATTDAIKTATTAELLPIGLKVCETKQVLTNEGAKYTFTTSDKQPNLLVFENNIGLGSPISQPGISPALSLSCILPLNNFGLIAFYNRTTEVDTDKNVYLACSDVTQLNIFNNGHSWWDRAKTAFDDSYYLYTLRPGLNIVQVPNTCIIDIYADTDCKNYLYFDRMSVVRNGDELNPKLGLEQQVDMLYKQASTDLQSKMETDNYNGGITTASIYKECCEWLAQSDPDHEFYYNNRDVGNIYLDLNDANETDTLAVPYNWYDPQNIYNKFIVSQLDTRFLPDNVRISRFSKL